MDDTAAVCEKLRRDGYAIIPSVYSAEACERFRQSLAALGESPHNNALRRRDDAIYAIRHLLDVWPDAATIWRVPRLTAVLESLLGGHCGLVRALLFDKPPQQAWAVPWHQDLTIAVEPPQHLSELYSPPRLKAGVWHCEPPVTVLERMLALRIHLDAVTDENGPLEVCAGTHLSGKSFQLNTQSSERILVEAGDVLAMRPLLAHASPRSRPGVMAHRRVVHLEFAADSTLPDGYRWHQFISIPQMERNQRPANG